MNAPQRPKTPPVLYLLAFLVVGGVWWFWNDARTSAEERHRRWVETTLDRAVIAENLKANEVEKLGHGLVQLQARLIKGIPAEDPWLASVAPEFPRLSSHDDPTVRLYLSYALAYWPGQAADQVGLLVKLLQDEDAKVSLNAAIGLAARNNPAGADRLQEAIAATKGEQQETRRKLHSTFRLVAQEKHRAFLQEELRLAELDHDKVRTEYCREALARLDRK